MVPFSSVTSSLLLIFAIDVKGQGTSENAFTVSELL